MNAVYVIEMHDVLVRAVPSLLLVSHHPTMAVGTRAVGLLRPVIQYQFRLRKQSGMEGHFQRHSYCLTMLIYYEY